MGRFRSPLQPGESFPPVLVLQIIEIQSLTGKQGIKSCLAPFLVVGELRALRRSQDLLYY